MAGSAALDLENGLSTSPPLPKALRLIKYVNVSDYVLSACHYQGNTYAGLYSGEVDKIDANYQLTRSFLSLAKAVYGVTVYKDRVYTLVYGNPNYTVNVHDLSGQLITSWSHADITNGYHSKFAIVADQLVITDRQNKRLTIYSLTGQIIKHLPCPEFGASYVALCSCGDDSVIVSDYGSARVFRMSITFGAISWASDGVYKPRGAACYGRNWVLVASYNSSLIRILDVNTGKCHLSPLLSTTA